MSFLDIYFDNGEVIRFEGKSEDYYEKVMEEIVTSKAKGFYNIFFNPEDKVKTIINVDKIIKMEQSIDTTNM